MSHHWYQQPSTVWAAWGTAAGTLALAWVTARSVRRETKARESAARASQTDQVARIAASMAIDSQVGVVGEPPGVNPDVWVTRAEFLVVNSSFESIYDVTLSVRLLYNGEPAPTLRPNLQTFRQDPLFGLDSGWNQWRLLPGHFVTWETLWDGTTTEHLATLEWRITFRDDLGQYWKKQPGRRAFRIEPPIEVPVE